jgi:hypothetical protein
VGNGIKVIEHSSGLILIHSKYQDNNACSYRVVVEKWCGRCPLVPKGFRLCQSYRKSWVQLIQRCILGGVVGHGQYNWLGQWNWTVALRNEKRRDSIIFKGFAPCRLSSDVMIGRYFPVIQRLASAANIYIMSDAKGWIMIGWIGHMVSAFATYPC